MLRLPSSPSSVSTRISLAGTSTRFRFCSQETSSSRRVRSSASRVSADRTVASIVPACPSLLGRSEICPRWPCQRLPGPKFFVMSLSGSQTKLALGVRKTILFPTAVVGTPRHWCASIDPWRPNDLEAPIRSQGLSTLFAVLETQVLPLWPPRRVLPLDLRRRPNADKPDQAQLQQLAFRP